MLKSFYCLLQVVPFMPIYGAPELVVPFVVDEKQKEAAEKYLTHLAEELKKSGLMVATEVKIRMQVAAEITDFAKQRRVDLIVMCTHGRSGITRWVLGSVAHKVLIRAETPIFLVHLITRRAEFHGLCPWVNGNSPVGRQA